MGVAAVSPALVTTFFVLRRQILPAIHLVVVLSSDRPADFTPRRKRLSHERFSLGAVPLERGLLELAFQRLAVSPELSQRLVEAHHGLVLLGDAIF